MNDNSPTHLPAITQKRCSAAYSKLALIYSECVKIGSFRCKFGVVLNVRIVMTNGLWCGCKIGNTVYATYAKSIRTQFPWTATLPQFFGLEFPQIWWLQRARMKCCFNTSRGRTLPKNPYIFLIKTKRTKKHV